ncbi:hypothetical protein SPBR_00105 [Sporothrix brasiliensis 5110]|uniref:Protein kinase domain-containing protein n=1 Tax=Sporothrix brasiliensis 5110 TaxID=1398154 RepID=A0A0C2IPI7_9PEZI|nr:uncharacterized protein SPBR_00105 [Sporothrix brasiliensis 5110]KIH90946.1 hypothetical protein SPBR_00105 [Sporothrix brasiliensis 5110]
MQSGKAKAEVMGRKAKLAHSYQELLDEFSNKDLKSVGNYTLGRLIGKGSFGKVYLATHKLTNGSKVVLKSAKKDDSNLAREIHHHRQFVHPHIARLYEVIVTESMVWLVLEYCQGDELYNYLLKHGKLPVDKVQRIFAQLVGAVSYVHLQSCVHRDLKLENILLDKHENVKLVDFGFTREYEGKANYLQTFCGTICYSAPEMLKGEKYAGEKVDVWSLGVILYALLCGELPFDDDDDDVTRRTILADEPQYPDHVPPEALSLLKAMLSKRPLLRPTLPDILAHPFLADHAAQQQTILDVPQPSPFTTPVEKESLQRMRSAGVDIDTVIESVLAQRCDALAGWWTLLIEKEQRKLVRRERKRKEKELEHRNSRRLSTTSSRLERLATVEEAGSSYVKLSDPPTPKSSRGRSQRRSWHHDSLRIDDFPGLSELGRVNEALKANSAGVAAASATNGNFSSNRNSRNSRNSRPSGEHRPPPVDKDSLRSASSSRQRRPIPPPKEGVLRSARSRGSTLHLVTTSDALAAAGAAGVNGVNGVHIANGASGAGGAGGGSNGASGLHSNQKVRKKTSQVIITHWKNMTHWIAENTRRTKGAGKRGGSHSTPNLLPKPLSRSGGGGGTGSSKDGGGSHGKDSKASSPRPQTSKYPASGSGGAGGSGTGGLGIGLGGSNTASLPKGVVANGFAKAAGQPTAAGPSSASAVTGGASGGGAFRLDDLGTPASMSGGGGGGGGAVTSGSSTANSPLSPSLSATTPSNTNYQQFYYQVHPQQQPQQGQAQQQQQPASAPRLQSTNSYKRQSLSPSPLTPRSAVRRSSAGHHGLRGRKSTSSSVSSIRSIHQHQHHHSHSKASSTSSNGSVSTATGAGAGSSVSAVGRSPHHSVKVLPATPTTTSFPSNLRLVRGSVFTASSSASAAHAFNEGMPLSRAPGSPNPFGSHYQAGGLHGGGGGGSGSLGPAFVGSSTPVMFAKRKRNIFKGPMLSFGNSGGAAGAGASGRSASGGSGAKHSHSRSASASGLGRRSGEITIEEEDEEEEEEMEDMEEEGEDIDDDDDAAANGHAAISRFLMDGGDAAGGLDDVEEVDQFSPIIRRPGEYIEEIYEDAEEEDDVGEPGDDVGPGSDAAARNGSPIKTHGSEQAVSAA